MQKITAILTGLIMMSSPALAQDEVQVKRSISYDNSFVDELCETLLSNFNLVKQEVETLPPTEFFSKRNLDSNLKNWAASSSQSALLRKDQCEGFFTIDERQYRLPTRQEMTILFPDSKRVSLTGSVKIKDNAETVALTNGVAQQFYADYYGMGNDVVYALRFKAAPGKVATRDHLMAYRYERRRNAIGVYSVDVSQMTDVTNIKDISNDEWWSNQHVNGVLLPLGENRTATYLVKGDDNLVISTDGMGFDKGEETGFARLICDYPATMNQQGDFLHYSLSGDNISVDDYTDGDSVSCISSMPARLRVYVRSNPGTPTLAYDGAPLADGNFAYGHVKREQSKEGVAEYVVTISKNMDASPRSFVLTLTADNGQKSDIHVTQPAFAATPVTRHEPIAADYFTALAQDGNTIQLVDGGTKALKAMEDAVRQQSNSSKHVTTKENLTGLVPATDLSLTAPVDIANQEERISIGNATGEVHRVTSSYYGTGNGVVYALRFIGTAHPAAYRYSFAANEGLKIDILPLDPSMKLDLKKDLTNDKLFARSAALHVVLPACGGNKGEGQGQKGALWTSSRGADDRVAMLQYDASGMSFSMIAPDAVALNAIAMDGPEPVIRSHFEEADDAKDMYKTSQIYATKELENRAKGRKRRR